MCGHDGIYLYTLDREYITMRECSLEHALSSKKNLGGISYFGTPSEEAIPARESRSLPQIKKILSSEVDAIDGDCSCLNPC
jgi:hypothetical protein